MNSNNEPNGERVTKRDEIQAAAKKLFYETGIAQTSFEAIGRECGVRPSLITYHFKTKNNLAAEVMREVTRGVKKTVERATVERGLPYELKTSSIAEMRLQTRLNNFNEQTRRFIIEYMNCGMETMFAQPRTDFFSVHEQTYRLGIDQSSDELRMIAVSAFASVMGLSYAYFKGALRCSFPQFEEYSVKYQYRLMHYPENEISELYQRGGELLQKLNITIEPYFVLKY